MMDMIRDFARLMREQQAQAERLADDMAAVCRGQFTPRTDIRFVPDGRGGVILQGRLVT